MNFAFAFVLFQLFGKTLSAPRHLAPLPLKAAAPPPHFMLDLCDIKLVFSALIKLNEIVEFLL